MYVSGGFPGPFRFRSNTLNILLPTNPTRTGPISRLQIKSNIPLSLHGTWAADAQFEGEDVIRKFKVYTGLSKFKEIDSAMQSIF